jgi:hypothetical protein
MPIQWHEEQETEVHVDEEGEFEFHFLTGPGEYTVTPFSALSGSSFDPGYEKYAETVELEEGGETVLDIECFEPVTMTVWVVDPSGNPIEGIPLWARQVVPELGSLADSRAGATDETGLFSYSGFEPGFEAWFSVPNGEFYVAAETDRYLGESGQAIAVETLVLYPHAGAEGRLTDAQGYPLADTSLSIVARYDEDREVRASAWAGPEGFFSLTKGIPATCAVLEITVEDEGESLRWSSESVELSADLMLDVGTIVLNPTQSSVVRK